MKNAAKDIRTGLLIGLGAMSLAVKKVNTAINELAQKKGITKAEAKNLSVKLLAEGKKQQAALKKIVDRELDNLQAQLDKRKKKPAKKKSVKKKPVKKMAKKR